MIDGSAEERAGRLRRIAAVEIERHRDAHGLLGAALEGSVATGAVWASSDVDFTIVPLWEQSGERLVEWEQRESLPFRKEHADRRLHIDVCGERGGVPWHKHITDSRALQDVMAGYPASFIRPAEGPFDPGAHWFLDGLAVMAVVVDPEGVLAEARQFVAARRFAAEVWEGRRGALLAEMRRALHLADAAMERGEADAAYVLLSGDAGFAAVAAQLWLESARRITSGKERDGQLAEVAAAAGCSEAHTLYRQSLAVEPGRAEAVVPLLLRLGERAKRLYRLLGGWYPEGSERYREAKVWGAYLAHLAGTLALAPGRGHPAHIYQSLRPLSLWATEFPGQRVEELRQREAGGMETLDQQAAEASGLVAQVRAGLLDPVHLIRRTWRCLAAAHRLLEVSERRL